MQRKTPYRVSEPKYSVSPQMVPTTFELPGYHIMPQHASEIGANAIIGARYDATEIARGATEVLVYGTAVIVEAREGTGIYGAQS